MMLVLLVAALASAAQAILISPPTGPYAVSMSVQDLTDDARLDPYAPKDTPHPRRLMTSTFKPVSKNRCAGHKTVPYMTPLVAEAYDALAASVGLPNGTISAFEMDFCVPKARPCGTFPLVLFSPGFGGPRLLYGAMARELASHGLAVVTIDHPYDPSFVEFPDGTVYRAVDINTDNKTEMEHLVKVRAEDVSFVLSYLQKNPVRGIDINRATMFGHSLGGATAAAAMLADERILGGLNLDGRLFEPVLSAGLDRPFALVGRPGHEDDDPTWDAFYAALRGRRAWLSVAGTTHSSFTDFPALIASLNLTLPEATRSLLENEIGTLESAGVVVGEIVKAFVDSVLGGVMGPLFTGGDALPPEISIVKAD